MDVEEVDLEDLFEQEAEDQDGNDDRSEDEAVDRDVRTKGGPEYFLT